MPVIIGEIVTETVVGAQPTVATPAPAADDQQVELVVRRATDVVRGPVAVSANDSVRTTRPGITIV